MFIMFLRVLVFYFVSASPVVVAISPERVTATVFVAGKCFASIYFKIYAFFFGFIYLFYRST